MVRSDSSSTCLVDRSRSRKSRLLCITALSFLRLSFALTSLRRHRCPFPDQAHQEQEILVCSSFQRQGRRQHSANERRWPSTQCKLSPHHARVNQEDVRENLLVQIREQSMEIMGLDSKCDINDIYEGLVGCPRIGLKVEWAFDTCATCSYM